METLPMPSLRRGLRSLGTAVLILAALFFFWLLPATQAAREAARRSQCVCNFCGIKLALENYHTTYGSLPPAFVVDAQGRPAHSWRVLILPFLSQSALYEAYDFEEPWNGPNNSKLLAQMPSNYVCPSHRDAKAGLTNYVLITGPGTAFPGASTVRYDDITDGTANTILAAETISLDIPWTAPVDLDVRTMSFRLNDRSRPSISSKHPGGANVVFGDGSYRFLTDSAVADDVKALTTIAGGEKVDPDHLGNKQAAYHDPGKAKAAP